MLNLGDIDHSRVLGIEMAGPADAFLAVQYGRDTTMIEIGMLVKPHESAELLADDERRFMSDLDTRPHGGSPCRS